MKPPTDRRTVLMASGAAALAAATGTAAAQPADIHGSLRFEGGAAIPEGHIKIYLEAPAAQDGARRRVAETRVSSDGGSKTIDFSFSRSDSLTALPGLQIVARLERADGWLLARGSAKVDPSAPVDVTLNKAIY